MCNTVHRFGGTDSVGVVGEGKCFAVRRRGCKLSAVLPCESVGRSAVVGQGITDRVIGDRMSLVGRQEVVPRVVAVAVNIGIDRNKCAVSGFPPVIRRETNILDSIRFSDLALIVVP